MEEIAKLRASMAQMKVEIEEVVAESLALQYVVVMIASHAGNAAPQIRPIILQAFDQAADMVEGISIAKGPRAGHVPKALQVIEQLRFALAGKNEPKHGV